MSEAWKDAGTRESYGGPVAYMTELLGLTLVQGGSLKKGPLTVYL